MQIFLLGKNKVKPILKGIRAIVRSPRVSQSPNGSLVGLGL